MTSTCGEVEADQLQLELQVVGRHHVVLRNEPGTLEVQPLWSHLSSGCFFFGGVGGGGVLLCFGFCFALFVTTVFQGPIIIYVMVWM